MVDFLFNCYLMIVCGWVEVVYCYVSFFGEVDLDFVVVQIEYQVQEFLFDYFGKVVVDWVEVVYCYVVFYGEEIGDFVFYFEMDQLLLDYYCMVF